MAIPQSSVGRRFLFAWLYFSEGAPIGFIWLALPTRLKSSGVPIESITWLMAMLVLPWSIKFAWAPVIDLVRHPRWCFRHWIVAAQCAMCLCLLPLYRLDPVHQFRLLAWTLLAHSIAAATQDVAIDGLCIAISTPEERGSLNGWMQTGMLLGRALLGGGALIMMQYWGDAVVLTILIGCIISSALLVSTVAIPQAEQHFSGCQASLMGALRGIGQSRGTWIGVAFALTSGAAFKSLEVIYGPFLVERGLTNAQVGRFALLMVVTMMIGSLLGGRISDHGGRRGVVAGSLVWTAASIVTLALIDHQSGGEATTWHRLVLIATALGIGMLTSSSYALLMDLTQPSIAATQFSAFMGATNGCESWSSYTMGRIIQAAGYPTAMLVMSALSLLALPLLLLIGRSAKSRIESQQ